MSIFTELKRRNVFRVGIAYLIGSWLLAQIAELLLDTFNAPEWTMQFIVVVLMVGFPIAIFLAWAFELTPDGVKRDAEVDRAQSIRKETGNKLDRSIIVILIIALAYFVWESRFSSDIEAPSIAETAIPAKPETQPTAVKLTEKSVAVLPFINMSSDPEQEYFSDGITEEIINALVKIPGLSVPARTSVFGFKGQQSDIRKIGEQLGVAHVLEGSIRSQGNQVRVTAQLIKVDDGFHLWSETFDRQLENIFVVQEEIATAIATVLIGELGLGVATVPNQTRNMEAYDIYLQGRALLRKRDDMAVEVLEKATLTDPGFAPGWAALAIAYQVGGMDEKAMQTAERALQIDPENVDALDAMASTLRTKMRWAEAESFYDRALAIDPQSSELLEDYAEFLSYVGRTKEALQVTTRGYAIDPNLMPLGMAHVEALLSNDKLDEALVLVDKMARENPGHRWMPEMQLSVHLAQDGYTPDEELLSKLQFPQDFLDTVKAIFANPSDKQAIERLKSRFTMNDVENTQFDSDSWFLARDTLAYAGESDLVLDVDMAVTQTSVYGAAEWAWTPNYKSIRENPRYEKYLELVGLIEYWDATRWPDWCQRLDDGRIECR
jgi:TolB-like protein